MISKKSDSPTYINNRKTKNILNIPNIPLYVSTMLTISELPKSERAAMPDLEETLIQCPECKENIPLNSLSGHMNQKHKPLHKAVSLSAN